MSYRIGLVCSGGGHLQQLLWLRSWWQEHDRFWVTFDQTDANALLAGERVYHAHGPTNRDLGNLARNLALAGRILEEEQPDVLVSNGAGVAVPFFWRGWMRDIPLVFMEVYDRVDTPSLTGRMLAPIVDEMLLMWPDQQAFYPRGRMLGPLR